MKLDSIKYTRRRAVQKVQDFRHQIILQKKRKITWRQKQRKKYIQRKLRVFLWAMVFPYFLKQIIEEKAKKRK